MKYGPAVRRRKLGAELRTLRVQAGLTSGEAARLVGWHQSKVSRIETGRSGVKPSDVLRLLDAFEARDPRLRELVVALAGGDEVGGHHWWHAYRGLLPPAYRDFISLESQACRIRTLETSVVPGLLQTPEYAHAVTRSVLNGRRTSTSTRWWRCGSRARTCCAPIRRCGSPPCSTRRCCAGGGRERSAAAAIGTSGRGRINATCPDPCASVLVGWPYRLDGTFRCVLFSEHI